jgi:ATPase subunit of ABC transporter with duplicated ATPase domains
MACSYQLKYINEIFLDLIPSSLLTESQGLIALRDGIDLLPVEGLQITSLKSEFNLDEDLSVWQVACAHVENAFTCLERFEELAQNLENPLDLGEYFDLLKLMTSKNIFAIPRRIEALLKACELDLLKRQTFSSLTKGQQCLVILISRLIEYPDVVVLDDLIRHLNEEEERHLLMLLQGNKV